MSPESAIERLKEGNKRFTSGLKSVDSLLAYSKMAELAEKGQKPFAIVLTCSDSRSPVELIFDEGLGDLFVVRVAGNVVAPSLLASMEFAVANFHSSVILVLGHTKCGAVDACVKHVENPAQELPSPHLEELIGRIRPAVEKTLIRVKTNHKEKVDTAIMENVLRSRSLILAQSQIIRDAVAQKQLLVEPALLDIHSGIVQFLS
jgi:carbonic anhydrase